jgi:hypothetical protein
VFLHLSWSPIIILHFIFQLYDFTHMILKWRSSLPLPCYVMLTVLNMIQKDRRTLVILLLMWVFLCDFISNPDFTKCSWFYMTFWNRFQILLNFIFYMKMQYFNTIFSNTLILFSTIFQEYFNSIILHFKATFSNALWSALHQRTWAL